MLSDIGQEEFCILWLCEVASTHYVEVVACQQSSSDANFCYTAAPPTDFHHVHHPSFGFVTKETVEIFNTHKGGVVTLCLERITGKVTFTSEEIVKLEVAIYEIIHIGHWGPE